MAVGRTAGWQFLRSTAFDVTRTSRGYRFSGVGYGHGVGMCVIGAGHRAARGESAAQILRAYFGDLTVGAVDAGITTTPVVPPPSPPVTPVPPAAPPPAATDIRLALPAAEERDRAVVTGLGRRARTDVARLAGVGEPAGVTITVHPTVESFGRATGQPWWVAASTVGREIDLLPVSVLRRRGALESTLRHEIAHVVVDSALAGKPVWVREGAAIYFTNPSADPIGESRAACPSDAELLRPVSAGAQREAYSRADRCFRRQLAQGRAWHDVR
jgi:stage II sporulation protein D